MTGDFISLYLNIETYKQVLKADKKYEPTYTPYITIRIIRDVSENVFEGLICMKNVFDQGACLTLPYARGNSIVTEYDDRQPGVFTFDGRRFFKIIGYAETIFPEKLITFTFQYLRQPTFSEKDTAFMIMPFSNPELDKFYRRNIQSFLYECDLKIKIVRSDDFPGTDVVADTILEQIEKAELIICDITSCNKNVFFEAGYAKAINKNIIFLLEKNQPSKFFDVDHVRRIEYSYENTEEFQNLLRDTIISVRNKSGII